MSELHESVGKVFFGAHRISLPKSAEELFLVFVAQRMRGTISSSIQLIVQAGIVVSVDEFVSFAGASFE